MNKIILIFLLCIFTTGFADKVVLDNKIVKYTGSKAKIAIQWAATTKDVDEDNDALKQGKKLNPNSLQSVAHLGKINLNIPKNAEYFRVLVWSKGIAQPDLLTNWVDVVPHKTYTITEDYLIPVILMAGMGC